MRKARRASRPFVFAHWVALAIALVSPLASAATAVDSKLATATAEASAAADVIGFDGVVEAVRQTAVAAQVAGVVVALDVKAGDSVKNGQVLLRIDARAAEQNTMSSDAQVRAARAAQDVAAREFERQKQLFAKNYISQGSLDRAEAQLKAAQAAVAAQLAQAGVSRTQTGFFVVRAPYSATVAEVPIAVGDMAMPGRPLLNLYDSNVLRVTVAIPQSMAASVGASQEIRVELPGLPAAQQSMKPIRATVLPTSDAATHTAQLRLDLPPIPGAAPGMFARVWFPTVADSTRHIMIPGSAIVRRAEVSAVYVVDNNGRAILRLVRVGRPAGERVEILSGLAAGERVALDPQAAARLP